jgi:Protein of unknown function (DUF2934)
MANKGNGNKTSGTTGRKSSTAKKQAKQPIPINTATSTGSGSVSPGNTTATQVYPGIEEEIRQRAYELYEERGRHEGFHEEDWARAETEVLAKRQKEKSA